MTSCLLNMSLTILPSLIVMMRCAFSATSCSCVTMMMVWPCLCSSLKSARICSVVLESRLPVGSSAMRIAGLLTSALAMATRCFCPPESSFGLWCMRSSRPTRLSASVASFLRDSLRFEA